MNAILAQLRGGLVVSVQAYAGSVLETPDIIALLARCAAANGAVAVRIEGCERIAAVRSAVTLPIVGIVKRTHPGFEPYITSTPDEVGEAAAAGADIVAFDATLRPHAGATTLAQLVAAARTCGVLAMADCATSADVAAAASAGADIVATTLAGYTLQTQSQALPALELVRAAAALHPFAVCEGGIATPAAARAAFDAGASAVVVGTAITNVDALVRRFAAVAPRFV